MALGISVGAGNGSGFTGACSFDVGRNSTGNIVSIGRMGLVIVAGIWVTLREVIVLGWES